MICSEGPENPGYVMHIFYLKYFGTPKYGTMLGNCLPVGPAQQTTEITPNIRVVHKIKEYVMHNFFAYSIPRTTSGNNFQWHVGILWGVTPQDSTPRFIRKRKMNPHKRFSKMISLNAENLESALLAEHHVAVMFSCRNLDPYSEGILPNLKP